MAFSLGKSAPVRVDHFASCWLTFDFIPRQFAACSKPPRRANHQKAPYSKLQQGDEGASRTQLMRSRTSYKRRRCPLIHAENQVKPIFEKHYS